MFSRSLALLLSLCAATLPAAIAVNSGVSVNGNTCDQVVWLDAAMRTRTASIVQLNGAGQAGKVGGYLSQIVYNDGAGNVTCNESGYSVDGLLSGLGQMVNHGGSGNGWVSSNQDGIKAGATTQVLFQGANHVIYQVDMDEYGDNGDASKGTWHDRWIYMVSTGHDYILESISYDFSNHIAGYWGYAGVNGQTAHDSRSPYCSFNWSGTGAANTMTESIDGVEWAARDSGTNSYIFRTNGSSPFSTGYTYNTPASNIPYTLQWKNSPDREIGYVSTLDLSQWAAGGGFTSESKIGLASATMPANWGVNYQANGFQSWMGDKMTWGVPYGAAGGTTGASTFPDWTYARNWTGYPTMGYTLRIQLGKHSDDNVRKQVAEQAAIHALASNALTAAVGTVQTTGKMNLQDPGSSFVFKPQGFNHIYDAWQVSCTGNAADVTLALGATTLQKPTFIFDNYNNASLCGLTLNGVTQVEGTHMFTSIDTVNKKLYITFNAAFTGNEHIVIPGSCATNTPTPTATATATACGACTSTPTLTPTLTPTGSNKSYCLTLDYSAVPSLLNYRKVTLNVNVGACASVTVTEDGSPLTATYNSGTGVATFTASSAAASSSIIVTAVGWTSGGTGAVTKGTLYNNYRWAFSQTFDDGYQSSWTYGKPVLDAHTQEGQPWRAGLAFTGSFVGQNWGADPALGTEYLMTTANWTAARAAGWDVYNHSWDHPNLTCANFQTQFDQTQTLALTMFPGYHVNHIVYPFENSTVAQTPCAGFAPSYLLSGEQNSDTFNYVDNLIPAGFQGNPAANYYAAARSGDVLNATASGNLAYWKAKADATAAASASRATWLIDICHRVYPGSSIGNDTSYSNNVTNLSAFYNYLDSTYGAAGGNGSMWVAPSGEVMDYLMVRDKIVVGSAACGTPTPTPTFCGACTSTFTATMTLTPTMTPTATATPACSGGLVDDLEDGNTQGALGGYWYTYAGSSTINAPFVAATPGNASTYSARAFGNCVLAAQPSLGVGLGSPSSDMSSHSGLSFWFKGDGKAYRVQLHSLVEGAAYNDFKYDFTPPVGWSLVNVPWASFVFPGWGTAYSFDNVQLTQISWVPMTAGAYDFSVDDVQFTCPTATMTPTTTRTATATRTQTPASSSTSTSTATATRTSTLSQTPTSTSSVSTTSSFTVTPSSTRTPSFTASVTGTYSASPSPTLTYTDVPPGSTMTNTPSISATSTASPSPTSSFSVTLTTSPTPTTTDTPTSSATPSPSSTVTPSVTPSFSASPTPSATSTDVPPGSTLTWTLSVTPSRTVTPASTATSTCTPVSTGTPTSTPSASPVSTPTSTQTPASAASPTSTGTSQVATASGQLQVLSLQAVPNPNPGTLAIRLDGAADRVTVRIYSVAETCVAVVQSGPLPSGWSTLALPLTWSAVAPNGLYFAQAVAEQGSRRSLPSASAKLLWVR